MSNILVTFSCNWADEIDCEGFMIMPMEKLYPFMHRMKSFAFSFGTNEGWDYEEDFTDSISWKHITPEEEATIRKLVPLGYDDSYGIFPSYWEDYCDDDF